MRRFFQRSQGRKPREARPELTLAEQVRRQQAQLWLWMAVLAFALWGILALDTPDIPGLRTGFPSPISIQAGRSLSFESEWRTERERTRAESDAATIVYREDETLLISQRALLDDLLQTITQVRDDPALDRAAKEDRLTAMPNSTVVVSPTLASRISRLDDDEWSTVRRGSLDLYDRAVRENGYTINDQALDGLRRYSLPYWSSLLVPGENQDIALLFAGSFLKANQVIDEQATAERKKEAREAVKPVIVNILEGESIVRQGDLITPDVEEKLRALGLLETPRSWWKVAGNGLLAALFAAVFGVYLRLFQRPIWMSARSLFVTNGLLTLTALAAQVLLPASGPVPYAFPLAVAALLLAGLFDTGLALVTVALLSSLVAYMSNGQLALALTLLVGSMAGVFVFGKPQRTLTFLMAGTVVAVVTALASLAFTFLSASAPRLDQMVLLVIYGGVNGALSAILALGLYNLLGQVSGFVTPFQLMELGHPAQPLLRRLMREAPGTYYHSIAVGNLAESAAEAVGADALLLRVAAYYHDIGKVVRPYFFTDNQSDRENVHNDLDPQTSAAIIASHVTEGVKLARDARLPQPILDFIPTHHGTSIIKHFYQLALQQQDTVNVDDFRYPGPRPRTREQAILMLADTVEATVRSKAQHGSIISARDVVANGNGRGGGGKQTLEELVNSIVDERIHSGQLDESPLTMEDVAKIRQAFISTLQGIYHPRVEYTPQLVKS